MLERLGRFAARRHWWVIGFWLVLAIVIGGFAQRDGGSTVDSFTIPGSEAQKAIDLVEENYPAANGASVTVVMQAPSGHKVTDPAVSTAIGQAYDDLAKLPDATAITSPLAPNSLTAANISTDGTMVYTSLQFSVPASDLPDDIVDQLWTAVKPATDAGIGVAFGGAVIDQFNQPASWISDHADDIGLILAVVILLISLGSAVAMLMPIGTALFGLGISTSLLMIVEKHVEVGSVAPILGTMLGLGVGIDYALFIVSRYRQKLAEGEAPADAVGGAIGTSGSAVLFAGITVVLAMVSLSLMGVPYVRTLGLAAAMYVVVAMLAALTLLPAVLGLLGTRIDAGRLPWHHTVAEQASADAKGTWSGRWAHEIAKKPWVFGAISLVLMFTLAVPVLKLELGFPTDASAPSDTTQRKAYDLLEDGFGPGVNGPLLVVGQMPAVDLNDQQQVQALVTTFGGIQKSLESVPGVDKVSILPTPNGKLFIGTITPTTGPNDSATADLVNRLRDTAVPDALKGTDIDASNVYVGGQTAILLDLTQRIDDTMFLIIGVVLLGSFLLLTMVFRSLVVPLTAVIMNLLSIGAAYGVLVAIFEWGWGRQAIGLEETVIIAAFVPIMMFAILFGLSMDYEVFLLSRIRESYMETGDPHDSIVVGVSNTARVITSAALIMIAVFLAFVTNPDATVKMIGIGLAVAVLVDATVVRMMLVPSVMEILGHANWYLPKWLDKVLPHLNVEGSPPRHAPPEPVSAPGPAPED